MVTDFDDVELPLRKEEKYNRFVVEFDGDEKRAQQNMAIEQTALEPKKDIKHQKTDAAKKPESSNASVSTQKFAIALSKDWISNAYNDVVAKNRSKIPNEIEIKEDSYTEKRHLPGVIRAFFYQKAKKVPYQKRIFDFCKEKDKKVPAEVI